MREEEGIIPTDSILAKPSPAWLHRASILQEQLGYHFQNPDLLLEAMSHSTYTYEQGLPLSFCNERLEFLGDAALSLTVAQELFQRLPEEPEGRLSLLRARLVCEQTLHKVAVNLGLGALLLLGNGEESTGGRKKASALADAVEALWGAIVRDSGFQAVVPIILRCLEPYIQAALEGKLVYDYKSLFLEKIQTRYTVSDVEFRLLNETGPAHCPEFTIGIFLLGELLGQGMGPSKKEATQQAAKFALEYIEQHHVFERN